MNKIMSIMSVIVFTATAQAGNPFQLFQSKLEKRLSKQANPSTRGGFEPSTCTDFRGIWEGVCTITDENGESKTSSNLKISQNGCSSITVDSVEYQLGNLDVTNKSQAFVGLNLVKIYDWNTDATELVMKVKAIAKVTLPAGQLIISDAGGRVYLDGSGQLITDFSGPSTKIYCENKRK